MNYSKYFALSLWFLTSCTGLKKAKHFQNNLTDKFKTVVSNKDYHDSIQVYYSGCSGFYFKNGNNGILHDPFLSNNGPLLKLNSIKLKVDNRLINQYFEKIIGKQYDSLGNIKALLASHTHYDHVLDLPEIIKNHLNTDSTIIGGNESVKVLLNLNGLKISKTDSGEKAIIFENLEAKASSYQHFNQWIYAQNRSFRILPIISDHAPHYYGIKFYKGSIDSTAKSYPIKAGEFKEGQSLSYIIDFLDRDANPKYRIYIQGSASQFPLGFPPQNLDNKAFDLAILCVASYQYVFGYPNEILERIKPKHVILSHWENFFLKRDQLYQVPTQVPFTNVKKFLKSYKKIAQKLNIKDFTMPISNTTISFKF